MLGICSFHFYDKNIVIPRHFSQAHLMEENPLGSSLSTIFSETRL